MALSIAVVGAGVIGKRHAELVTATTGMTLAALVDPASNAAKLAAKLNTQIVTDLELLLRTQKVDGVIIASPSNLHVPQALQCLEARVPVLVEKPVSLNVSEGARLVEAERLWNAPVLVGHHRRHNPIIRKAREIIDKHRLGQIVTVHSSCWLHKADSYFLPEWRRRQGAGPILTNSIHDIDLLQHLCGPIVGVCADASSAVRGFEIEDTAVALLRFQSGALGTLTISDSVSAPWSWELSASENPDYPATGEFCYLIGGTQGSLQLPNLALWRHSEAPNWMTPIETIRYASPFEDPLALQLKHFADVIEGVAPPAVTVADALRAVSVVEAIIASSQSGHWESVQSQ